MNGANSAKPIPASLAVPAADCKLASADPDLRNDFWEILFPLEKGASGSLKANTRDANTPQGRNLPRNANSQPGGATETTIYRDYYFHYYDCECKQQLDGLLSELTDVLTHKFILETIRDILRPGGNKSLDELKEEVFEKTVSAVKLLWSGDSGHDNHNAGARNTLPSNEQGRSTSPTVSAQAASGGAFDASSGSPDCEISGAVNQSTLLVAPKNNCRSRPLPEPQDIDDEIAECILALCLRLCFMINIRSPMDFSVITRTTNVAWEDGTHTLSQFLEEKGYRGSHLPWKCERIGGFEKYKNRFRADNLERTCGLKITCTSNLADHLKFYEEPDKKRLGLTVFCHVAFVRDLYDLQKQQKEESERNQQTDGVFQYLPQEFLRQTLWTFKLLFPDSTIFTKYLHKHMRLPTSKGQAFLPIPELESFKEALPSRCDEYFYYIEQLEQILVLLLKKDGIGVFHRPLYYEKSQHQLDQGFLGPSDGTPFGGSGDQTPDDEEPLIKFKPPPPRMIFSGTVKTRMPRLGRLRQIFVPKPHNCPRYDRKINVRPKAIYCGYLMVAIFDDRNGIQEELIKFKKRDISERELFEAIRAKYRRMYGWRRFVWFKTLTSFRIYQCEKPDFCSHTQINMKDTPGAQPAMTNMYAAYRREGAWVGPSGVRTAWLKWIDENLNGNLDEPSSGKTLGIELVIDWSGKRIAVLMVLLVVASIALGLGLTYQAGLDVQTSWTIASFMVTSGALLAAVLAILKEIRLPIDRSPRPPV